MFSDVSTVSTLSTMQWITWCTEHCPVFSVFWIFLLASSFTDSTFYFARLRIENGRKIRCRNRVRNGGNSPNGRSSGNSSSKKHLHFECDFHFEVEFENFRYIILQIAELYEIYFSQLNRIFEMEFVYVLSVLLVFQFQNSCYLIYLLQLVVIERANGLNGLNGWNIFKLFVDSTSQVRLIKINKTFCWDRAMISIFFIVLMMFWRQNA